MATGGFLATSPANAQKADNNPDLPVQCGLDIVLVLDASGSIKYSNDPAVQDDKNGSIDRVASAADAFLNAFSNTNSRVAVVSYSHDRVLSLPVVSTAHRLATRVVWQVQYLQAPPVTLSTPAKAVQLTGKPP